MNGSLGPWADFIVVVWVVADTLCVALLLPVLSNNVPIHQILFILRSSLNQYVMKMKEKEKEKITLGTGSINGVGRRLGWGSGWSSVHHQQQQKQHGSHHFSRMYWQFQRR